MITLIAAMDKQNAIGRDNALPWHISGDMKFFRETTTGHSVVMGRKTWDSLGKPLKNRTNIVVTRHNLDILAIVKNDIVSALCYGKLHGDVYVIGGGEIYRLALPHADRLLISLT
jgi:dihydrofolate reductase